METRNKTESAIMTNEMNDYSNKLIGEIIEYVSSFFMIDFNQVAKELEHIYQRRMNLRNSIRNQPLEKAFPIQLDMFLREFKYIERADHIPHEDELRILIILNYAAYTLSDRLIEMYADKITGIALIPCIIASIEPSNILIPSINMKYLGKLKSTFVKLRYAGSPKEYLYLS